MSASLCHDSVCLFLVLGPLSQAFLGKGKGCLLCHTTKCFPMAPAQSYDSGQFPKRGRVFPQGRLVTMGTISTPAGEGRRGI